MHRQIWDKKKKKNRVDRLYVPAQKYNRVMHVKRNGCP